MLSGERLFAVERFHFEYVRRNLRYGKVHVAMDALFIRGRFSP
jgi:hypothetical protein